MKLSFSGRYWLYSLTSIGLRTSTVNCISNDICFAPRDYFLEINGLSEIVCIQQITKRSNQAPHANQELQ
jgi:hypothetical protein